jgi:hypothetical protein
MSCLAMCLRPMMELAPGAGRLGVKGLGTESGSSEFAFVSE